MIYKFTVSSEKVLQIAKDIASSLGHNYVGTEHILYGLSKEHNGIANKVLKRQNITSDNILEKIEDLIGSNLTNQTAVLGFTPRTKKVIENAYSEAKKSGSEYIGTEHFIIGIIKEQDSIAMRIIASFNVESKNIYNDIFKVLNEFDNTINDSIKSSSNGLDSYGSTPLLNQFSNDLSKEARLGNLDPVIGRNFETERVIEILSRRTKNNPCLIGEPGVGKTAVIEGLAQKIISRKHT